MFWRSSAGRQSLPVDVKRRAVNVFRVVEELAAQKKWKALVNGIGVHSPRKQACAMSS
jgi:hypothetical protein